jgi:hypothetical protein
VGQKSLGFKALTLLDALQPAGAFEILVDRDGAVAQLGALGAIWPQAAAEVLLGEGFEKLGLCVAGVGKMRAGAKAVSIEIRHGGSTEKFEVSWGEIRSLPIEPGSSAEVIVKPHGGLDFGWGKGKTGKAKVTGGALGFIVDARGRPVFEAAAKSTGEQMTRWLRSLDRPEAK